MIKLQMSLTGSECAQGKYIIRARGFILAVLRWGCGDGPLPGWSPFAYVPIDPAGNGMFFFSGRHGIPPEASHVWACCYTADFSACETASATIPDHCPASDVHTEGMQSFSVMSDLHLTSKPWKVRQALRAARSDTIFLLGDSTNDGLAEQFELFATCIEEAAPEKILLPVIGNHDVPCASQAEGADGCKNYADFQKKLLSKAALRSCAIDCAPDHRAYSAQLGELDVIGLQCVTEGRRFLFPIGAQIDWLEEHLASTTAAWHVILCHAPMLKHNPNRNEGVPYVDKNRRLRKFWIRTGGSSS